MGIEADTRSPRNKGHNGVTDLNIGSLAYSSNGSTRYSVAQRGASSLLAIGVTIALVPHLYTTETELLDFNIVSVFLFSCYTNYTSHILSNFCAFTQFKLIIFIYLGLILRFSLPFSFR